MSGFVYAIACSGAVKIGFTKSPRRRFAALRTGSPFDQVVIGVLAADREHEKRLHERFAAERLRGEWFQRSDRLDRALKFFRPLSLASRRGRAQAPVARTACPKTDEDMRHLFCLFESYCAATGLSEATVSASIFNHAGRVARLRAGRTLLLSSYRHAFAWFSANWPSDLAWPSGVERLAPSAWGEAA